MNQEVTSILNLPPRKKAKINSIIGGHGFQIKLQAMGIRKGQEITVISRQPFRGPLTIKVCGSHMTLGRGMANKILVEDVQ